MAELHPDYDNIVFELEDLLENEYSVYSRICFAVAHSGENIDNKFVKNSYDEGDIIVIEEYCEEHGYDEIQYMLTNQSIDTINIYRYDYCEYYVDEGYDIAEDVDPEYDDSETLVLEGAKRIMN